MRDLADIHAPRPLVDGLLYRDTLAQLAATIVVKKHKDVPSGQDLFFRLVPHTVSEHAMPHRGDRRRATLVFVSSPAGAETATVGRKVEEIIVQSAPLSSASRNTLRPTSEGVFLHSPLATLVPRILFVDDEDATATSHHLCTWLVLQGPYRVAYLHTTILNDNRFH